MLLSAVAQAQPNIALIKYWGKRDAALNLPATDSLSLTLDSLWTRTRVRFEPGLAQDVLEFNGGANAAMQPRVATCLDWVRALAGSTLRARVQTRNNFPTAAGLASSASGFAALVVAATQALGLALSPAELSVWARRCSGSAARSIFGGICTLENGREADGSDTCARALLDADAWPLEVVVAVTSLERKAVSSGTGMQSGTRTSPYYAAWVDTAHGDLQRAKAAVASRDFAALAHVSEHNCLKMHAVMMTSEPALIYWTGATLAVLQRVRTLRERDGRHVFFTVDAGPQVKAVCLPEDADSVASALRAVPGVQTILRSRLGAGARCIADSTEI